MLMRKYIPMLFVLVSGVSVVLGYFLQWAPLQNLASTVLEWQAVLAIFALGLGIVSLLGVHFKRLRRSVQEEYSSIVMLVAFAITAVLGIGFGTGSDGYKWIFNNLHVPMRGAMFAMLAFHMASATFRAFRVRSVEAAILVAAGSLVMIGQVPLGQYLIPASSSWRNWIMTVANVGPQRAIVISGALGLLGVSLRIISGLERSTYGGE